MEGGAPMSSAPLSFDDDVLVPIAPPAKPKNTPAPGASSVPDNTALLVNRCQKNNPVLQHIRNVKWNFNDDLSPDYQLGKFGCALFLSMQYHLLHPTYIDTRIRRLGRDWKLRVLLCMVDVGHPDEVLQALVKLSYDNNFTLLLVWSSEEAARYLETFKAYEHKPADLIKPRVDPGYYAQLTEVLTSVRSINKTDVFTLASNFGSLRMILDASEEELRLCEGLGEKKVARLWEAFHGKLA